ncbi:LysR family transcriptional regulator (plasmid) [Burkholderia glumae]|uniref:LysR family transcriptional regulator n=2 Tax=Burkholderia glumae TaxID=337 RepID=A0AAP9Y532_BURGL|nr:Transcriptional regulator, LysR family [Burkholderia glumae BGR1]AJY62495.1 bacterial regulatory helix-turn-helix, lysR family protein [Burkholderia glumae LMG 2196 = ATCC 33617]KHJ59866.1 LysR family transcriptional regulator [Burkholderia glumae]PNL04101.1 LysR family transcriptional regulator [Burkholderia glumae]QHP94823.1 LysR family transcriptional regulator [Burkholderia glumae]
MRTTEWTDLMVFVEVARGPSLTAAGQRLGIDLSTVRRRLATLQDTLGRELFQKQGRSLSLSVEGERIFHIAQRMEMLASEISNDFSDAERDLNGVVKVSTMEGFGSFYLAPRLTGLVKAHPGLSIQLINSPHILNLAEREADISLNMMKPHRGRFLVEKLAEFSVGLFAMPSYIEANGMPETMADLKEHTFVTYVEDLISVPYVLWLPEILPEPRVQLSCSSLVAQYHATCAGAGLAMLPLFMAIKEPRLVRLFPEKINLMRDWWMVVHRDLEAVPRIRAVMEFFRKVTAEDIETLVAPIDKEL